MSISQDNEDNKLQLLQVIHTKIYMTSFYTYLMSKKTSAFFKSIINLRNCTAEGFFRLTLNSNNNSSI